jgi:hypothetical protein
MKNGMGRTRKSNGHIAKFSFIALLASAPIAIPFHGAEAQIAPSLGTAQSFAVLGASTVTNTGPTVVTGDLGVSPGTAITGFPPGLVIGATHAADAVASGAQSDTTAAYNELAGQACNTTYGVVLGPVDGSTHTRRRRRPQCGLGVQDRKYPRYREQCVRGTRQRRSKL